MAVPKRRQSKARSKKRNSHKGLTPKLLQKCPTCGMATPSHVVCVGCGAYQGRHMVDPKVKKTKSA